MVSEHQNDTFEKHLDQRTKIKKSLFHKKKKWSVVCCMSSNLGVPTLNFLTCFIKGNTSEIQEAFSEAASSHSVGSVEEDDDNDNMSDMISANVSGRGTPNISGRDTPLSQAGSVEEAPPPQMPLPEIPPLPQTIPKPNREDVTDRFGKFEIRADIESKELNRVQEYL